MSADSDDEKDLHQAILEFACFMERCMRVDADPLAVFSVGISQCVARAGALFDSQEHYASFVANCVASGVRLHNQVAAEQAKEEIRNGTAKHFH
jgi:hypothetical protein